MFVRGWVNVNSWSVRVVRGKINIKGVQVRLNWIQAYFENIVIATAVRAGMSCLQMNGYHCAQAKPEQTPDVGDPELTGIQLS